MTSGLGQGERAWLGGQHVWPFLESGFYQFLPRVQMPEMTVCSMKVSVGSGLRNELTCWPESESQVFVERAEEG